MTTRERLAYCAEHGVFKAVQDGKHASYAEAADVIERLERQLAEFRNFVEEVAGSCIPDYEEAKRDAQRLLVLEPEKKG